MAQGRSNKLLGIVESRKTVTEERIFKDEEEFTREMRKERRNNAYILGLRDETLELTLRATSHVM